MESLRGTVISTLRWVAAHDHASAGDHLEAIQLLRALVSSTWTSEQWSDFELGARTRFLSRPTTSPIDRDARTRAADALRAARAVVALLCPQQEIAP